MLFDESSPNSPGARPARSYSPGWWRWEAKVNPHSPHSSAMAEALAKTVKTSHLSAVLMVVHIEKKYDGAAGTGARQEAEDEEIRDAAETAWLGRCGWLWPWCSTS